MPATPGEDRSTRGRRQLLLLGLILLLLLGGSPALMSWWMGSGTGRATGRWASGGSAAAGVPGTGAAGALWKSRDAGARADDPSAMVIWGKRRQRAGAPSEAAGGGGAGASPAGGDGSIGLVVTEPAAPEQAAPGGGSGLAGNTGFGRDMAQAATPQQNAGSDAALSAQRGQGSNALAEYARARNAAAAYMAQANAAYKGLGATSNRVNYNSLAGARSFEAGRDRTRLGAGAASGSASDARVSGAPAATGGAGLASAAPASSVSSGGRGGGDSSGGGASASAPTPAPAPTSPGGATPTGPDPSGPATTGEPVRTKPLPIASTPSPPTPVANPPPSQKPVKGGCFVAGTRVLTPGGEEAIETLRPGDVVFSVDPLTRRLVPEKVLAGPMPHEGFNLHRISLEGGASLDATSGHPFYVPAKGDYVPARELKPGDELLAFESGGGERIALEPALPAPDRLTWRGLGSVEPGPGAFAGRSRLVRVLSVERLPAPSATVYNLTMDGPFHNYVAEGVLVHNLTPYMDGSN